MTFEPKAVLIGLGLALLVGGFATAVRLDRERSFYPVVLIVVASYNVLFATLSTGQSLGAELVAAAGFVVAAVVGFRRSLWLVAVGLAAHGILDAVHGRLIANPGVPTWWPSFCGSYDVAAAAYLGWRLSRPDVGGVAGATPPRAPRLAHVASAPPPSFHSINTSSTSSDASPASTGAPAASSNRAISA